MVQSAESRRVKYKMTLQYLGGRYHGWQIQRSGATVQGTLSEVLSRLAGSNVVVVGAGRTDAGVHALGQVAHFLFPIKDSIPDLRRALNALLPWDIRVTRVARAGRAFHAQRCARKKRYEYRVYTGEVLPPFMHGQILHLPRPLDLEAMQRAAELVVGRHDFSGFAASTTAVRDRRRTVLRSEFVGRGNRILYRTEADGFLHHMVRNLVGTFLQVGLGERPSEDVAVILESGDRRTAGPTAPPEGLYLVRVWY